MQLTPEEFDFLKPLFERLSEGPLMPTDERYEPLYESLEDQDPVERMARAINFSSLQSRQFFSGFRGAGKSTQLLRLKAKLESQNYCVYYANALDYLNPALPIEISDLLVILAGAFSESVEASNPGLRLLNETYWERLANFLLKTRVELEGIDLAIPGDAVKLKLAMKDTPTIRQRIQHELTLRLSELERQVHKLFEDYVKALQGRFKPRGIVFLFDNLEQIRGARDDREVIESVERLFRLHIDRLAIPYVHVVYTVPPWLKFRLPATEVEILPSIVQWKNDADRSPEGKGDNCLLSVISRRFLDDGMSRFFGEDDCGRDRARQLVKVCGGNLRDLIRLLRESILRVNELPVTDKVILSSIRTIREQFLPIPIEDAVWLARIARDRVSALPNSNTDMVDRLTLFLDTHMVLFLRNGEEWYDVHPLIRENVAQIAAREEANLKNGKENGA